MTDSIAKHEASQAQRIVFYSFLLCTLLLAGHFLYATYVESRLYIEAKRISSSLDRLDGQPHASHEFNNARQALEVSAAEISRLVGVMAFSRDQYAEKSWESFYRSEEFAGYEKLYHLVMKFTNGLESTERNNEEAIENIRAALTARGLEAKNIWSLFYKMHVARYSCASYDPRK